MTDHSSGDKTRFRVERDGGVPLTSDGSRPWNLEVVGTADVDT